MSGPLTDDFTDIDLDAWRARAARAADAMPVTDLGDGLSAQWLYTQEHALAPDPGGLPAHAPFVRGGVPRNGWEIRQLHGEADRAATNRAILEDLEGGVTAIELQLDRAARAGAAPGSDAFAEGRGEDGVALSTLDDLDATLDGVLLDLAPIALRAGAQALPAAALLVALWEQRGHDLASVRGSFGCDPLGTLAGDGLLAQPAEEALAAAGALAAETAALAPQVTALAVDTRAYADAGASPVQELAIALSTGVAYLRACAEAGLDPVGAAAQIELGVSVGTDQFLELAKLRALRRTWARVLEASGAPADARHSRTFARTSGRMLATLDPWVNILRTTTAAFAAAVGGADGVSVAPFDTGLVDGAAPSRLGRRIARNTQLVLAEEASLARVADPGGGSWYVESLTDELARAAWARFQQLEREGGVLAGLRSGALAAAIADSDAREQDAVVHRTRMLTGVNSFPLLGDDQARRGTAPDRAALAAQDAARLAERAAAPDLAAARDAAPSGRLRAAATLAAAGARLDELAAAFGAPAAADPVSSNDPGTAGASAEQRIAPLPPTRVSAAFERLRAEAVAQERATGVRPRVLLAGLGPIAAHVRAATWARTFFEAGGIEPRSTPPLEPGNDDAITEAFDAGDARIAAVCASPKAAPADIAAAVAALRSAGARAVYLPLATAEQADAAGGDALRIADGVDMVAVLGAALEQIRGDGADDASRTTSEQEAAR